LAVETLARIAGDEGLPPETRIRASSELLNRGYGKPVEFREEHREQVVKKESALENRLYGKQIADMSEEEMEAEIDKMLKEREEEKAFRERIGYKSAAQVRAECQKALAESGNPLAGC
jgi:hypothetical protein